MSESLPADAAGALLHSAREAFDSGVVWTSVVGVVLMLIAAAVVAVAMRPQRTSAR